MLLHFISVFLVSTLSVHAEPSASADGKIDSAFTLTCALKKFCKPEAYTEMDKKILESAESSVKAGKLCTDLKEYNEPDFLKGIKSIAWVMERVGKKTCLSLAEDAKGT